jgi:hypothetical protein
VTAPTWRPAHPWSPHLHGVVIMPAGEVLIGQVNRYDGPDGAEFWIGFLRLRDVTGRMATSDEACRAVEGVWADG